MDSDVDGNVDSNMDVATWMSGESQSELVLGVRETCTELDCLTLVKLLCTF